jgi:hypothetical protein
MMPPGSRRWNIDPQGNDRTGEIMGMMRRRTRRRTALVVGGAAYAAGRARSRNEQQQYDDQGYDEPPPAPPPPAPTEPSQTDELARLGELHANGTLTDDEFAAAKAKLLGI